MTFYDMKARKSMASVKLRGYASKLHGNFHLQIACDSLNSF